MPSTQSIYLGVMNAVGSNDGLPPEANTLRFTDREGCEKVVASNNDGFEVWLGSPDRWAAHYRAEDIAKITRWLIVEWYIKARWLGLRRPIYYWALHRYVVNFKRQSVQS